MAPDNTNLPPSPFASIGDILGEVGQRPFDRAYLTSLSGGSDVDQNWGEFWKGYNGSLSLFFRNNGILPSASQLYAEGRPALDGDVGRTVYTQGHDFVRYAWPAGGPDKQLTAVHKLGELAAIIGRSGTDPESFRSLEAHLQSLNPENYDALTECLRNTVGTGSRGIVLDGPDKKIFPGSVLPGRVTYYLIGGPTSQTPGLREALSSVGTQPPTPGSSYQLGQNIGKQFVS
jgi:hypothetical protein|tara:strand:+ start:694 stop:1386 length:693 start_codon:yes stop_codon:yes gene_type:complete